MATIEQNLQALATTETDTDVVRLVTELHAASLDAGEAGLPVGLDELPMASEDVRRVLVAHRLATREGLILADECDGEALFYLNESALAQRVQSLAAG